MPSIDNKVYGLQTSVFNDLKKAGPLTQEKVLAAVSKDGVIDQAEQDLLNEIESGNTDLELSDKSEAQISQLGAEGTTFDPVSSGTSVKLNFSQVGAKVKERSLSEEASIRASGLSMRTRSEARRQLGGDIESVTRLLEADQTMTGNPTQNRVNLESARKMLVQDLNLLQKMGLLSTDEKAKLDQIIDFMKKNITKSVPPSTLKAQVEQLSAMIKPHLESLKGASPSDVLTVDQGSLAVINSDAGGDIDTQMQTVDTNFDALLAAGDAAADDVRVSGLETGLSQDNMQGAKVNAGRDFGRMMGAIDEADKQHAILTDNVIPTVEKFIQETEKKIDARIMELYEKPTLEEAKAAMAADPSKAKGDEQLQGLILKRNDAIVKYQQLADKVKVLAQARVDGLKQFKEVKTIHSDMVARVNDIGLTGSDLSVAYGQLASLKAKVTDAQTRIAELSAKASELETSNAPDKAQQLESLNAQIDGIKKSLTGNQKDVEAIRAKMQTGLQQLHDKLKAGGANPTELKLVTQQIDSLSRLQLSGGKSIEDMAADLSILENNREHTLKDLKQLVPSRLDIREFKALTQLDQNVTKTSRSVLDIQREIRTGNFSADAAKASIDLAITSAKSDVGAADNMIGKAKQFEDPKKGGYVGIAYGSHFGVELWAGLGVGGDIGIAEAKISASLNAALKVSKDFEHGERPYRLQVDLGIKVEGDLSIAKIFDAHAEVKAGLSAGLAFKDLGEVGDFAKRMGKVMALANAIGHIGGMSDVSEIQAQLDKEIEELGKVIKEKGYTGNYLEIGASAKSQLPGADLGLKGNWRRQENTFNDGQTVQTDNYMGKLNVGEFGVKVTHNRSQVTAENGQPVTGKPVSTRTAVHITLPTEMISHAMKHGGFKNLPKGLMEEVVKQFKALNPMMAEFSTGMVLSCLDTAISKSSADGTLAKILDLAKQNRAHHPGAHGHSHGENEIAIGIEYIEHWHNDQHGEGYFAVEFGVEGDKEYKKDIPLGSVGHVRLGAKASYDLGVYVKIPGTKHELHPPSTTGGHH